MTPPKETNENSMTEPTEMEISKLSDKELRIILLKKLSELQENTAGQLKIRKTMHEENEKFNRKLEAIKKITKS